MLSPLKPTQFSPDLLSSKLRSSLQDWSQASAEELAKDGPEVAKGFLIDGPKHLADTIAQAEEPLGKPLSQALQDLDEARKNPNGLLAGLKDLDQARLKAVLDELKRSATTPRGQGELLFNLLTGKVAGKIGGALEREAPLAEARIGDVGSPAKVGSGTRTGDMKPGARSILSGTGQSELGNALSNLGGTSGGRNLHTLDQFGVGAGYSGVYDVNTGKYLAYPSGETRLLNGNEPANLVKQYGGHLDVNDALSSLLGTNSSNRLGFSMVIDQSGNFAVKFSSRTINTPNTSFEGSVVPDEQRQGNPRYNHKRHWEESLLRTMKINNLIPPKTLETNLRSGTWKLTSEQQAKLKTLIFGVENPSPILFSYSHIINANSLWTTKHREFYLGTRSSNKSPGDVDPKRTLIIGESDPDSPIALDYRTDEPRVIYLCELDYVSYWIELCANYDTLMILVNKP